MSYIKAIATKLIDDSSYPEVVLCYFFDFNGKKHEFIEKWPVLSDKKFINQFPTNCVIGCTVIKENTESYIVSTKEPWAIESEEGYYEFEISKSLIINI
ncbi:MAG: hypothetical protein PUA56_06490 [Bacillales bacterium]|nr:hypothetical protein [Bacillales bacterium]